MVTSTFDTLGYFEKLTSAGMPEPLAKVQADTIRNLIEDNLATKNDLKIALAELKHDLLRWIIGLVLAQTGLIIVILCAFSVLK
ncbi:MAG: hypothetical protein LBR82_08055 [Desulfovibrio sp.]|nr:hypothetical protein [Desulfovibrio sp.]